jgi:hypothetical protein
MRFSARRTAFTGDVTGGKLSTAKNRRLSLQDTTLYSCTGIPGSAEVDALQRRLEQFGPHHFILNCDAPWRFASATRLPLRRRQTPSTHRCVAHLRYKPNIDGRYSRLGDSGQILPFDPKEIVYSMHSPMLLPLPIAAGSILPAFDQSSRRVQRSAFEPPSAPSRRRAPRSVGRARATRRIRRRALPA